MATQIIHLETRQAPSTVPLRPDVQRLLVLVTDDDRPRRLLNVPRPAGSVLVTGEMLAGTGWNAQWCDGFEGTAASRQPVSVVVPTRARPDDLHRCLETLLAAAAPADDVIVVDNDPAVESTRQVTARFPVRYVEESARGLNRARNAGIAAARHAIVALVDDDVCVGRRWIEAIGRPFGDAAVAAVTGLVLPMELETEAQEEFERYSQHWRQLEPRRYSRATLRASAAALVGMGANMAFRRDAVISLGGFDVRLDGGTRTRAGGDTDMFARVIDAGLAIAFNPAAYVWHRHRRAASDITASVFGYSVGTFSVLAKRVVEHRDLGAAATAARWLVGPVVKTAWSNLAGRPAPSWRLVAADVAGAVAGPFCFALEASRAGAGARPRPVARS